MKNQMLPGIALTIVIAAVVAAATRRPPGPGNGRAGAVSGAAAAGRPPPWLVLAGETAPGPVTPEDREPHPAAAAAAQSTAADETGDGQPGAATRPGAAAGQMQYVFHELHADGRHAICALCNGQRRD
jgi:hypothetical protein